MRFAMFSARSYDRDTFNTLSPEYGLEPVYFEHHLGPTTAASAKGFTTVCAFVQDNLNAQVLEALHGGGVKLVALRCAGFNQVDLRAAARLGITVARVPAYSPESVAEHAVALILSLARRIPRAYNRVREGNFSLEGLTGFCIHGKTVGLIGLGKIGIATARIMKGFGCHVLAHDPTLSPSGKTEAEALDIALASVEEVLRNSDIVSLHCPLTPATRHLLNAQTFGMMKPGAMLINTSRGAVVHTAALIRALKSGQVGSVGLDVYEEEADLFFDDLSEKVMQDDVFARLLTFPNVIVTGHQGFFTREALHAIAQVTCENVSAFAKTGKCPHTVSEAQVATKV
jgi:D-lactate dehydrogenase